MKEYVTDTHSLLWHLSRDNRLSNAARAIFQEADIGRTVIFVPSIVIVEVIYLTEKWRVPREVIQNVLHVVQNSAASYPVAPLDLEIAMVLSSISRTAIPDVPDRIIAATAYRLGIPLITHDAKIRDAGVVHIVW